jgi:hypothetical protein
MGNPWRGGLVEAADGDVDDANGVRCWRLAGRTAGGACEEASLSYSPECCMGGLGAGADTTARVARSEAWAVGAEGGTTARVVR